MASITPHNGKYRAHVCINGKRKSKLFNSKREAEQWARTSEYEMASAVSDEHSFKELLEHYRDTVTPSKRGHRWEYIRINALLKSSLPINKPLSSMTSETIGKWRDERLKTVGAGTILRDFGLMSAIFEHARRELKWVKDNPVKDVRKPRTPDHRTTVITWRQAKVICKALGYSPTKQVATISQSVAVCFLLALRSGMRASEICNLTWGNVHESYCVLPVTKTTPRQVPLSAKALKILNKMRGYDKHKVFLFHAQTLDSLFRKAKSRAGIENITFHDSRHTAATLIARNPSIDVLTLCKIFGWKNTSQALTYYNPKSSDIAKLL